MGLGYIEQESVLPSNNAKDCLYRTIKLIVIASLLVMLNACANSGQNTALGLGVTAGLAVSPSNEIEQIYYLGTFDPQSQLPPTIYRVRVRGQGSALSNVKFASGWLPAEVVDSLTRKVSFDETGVSVSSAQGSEGVLDLHRRLMQFGPEGFREAPANHRLVIVMGADPSNYFNGIERALGEVSKFRSQQDNSELKAVLFPVLVRLQDAELELKSIGTRIDNLKN